MPMHKGWLPREGFYIDPLIKMMSATVFSPTLLLPLVLLARYTKRGQDLSILYPRVLTSIKTCLYLGLVSALNRWYTRRSLNNWVKDRYDWTREVVLVTGGAGGIGGSIVRLFAEMGVKVVVLDIQPALTYSAPSNVHYYKCDITSTSALAAVAVKIRADVGDPTVMINNAGVARGKTILGGTERDVRFTFDVNTLAHFWMARQFLPAMVRANHGTVVTVASFAAWVTAPDMVDYAASKAASMAFHEGLAAELKTRYRAPRVRTILVHQGYTKTPLFEGFGHDDEFILPPLEPDTVAQGIVEKVLRGESGRVVLPGFAGGFSAYLRVLPDWYQNRVRETSQKLMGNWKGRQVVDLDKHYEEKEAERQRAETEESTVLVPEVKTE